MPATDPPPIDPRVERAAQEAEQGVMPTVRRPSAGLSTAAVVGIALVLGLLLFTVLNARRTATSVPTVTVPKADQDLASAAPPALYVPPEPPPAVAATPEPAPSPTAPVMPMPAPPPVQPPPQVVYMPAPQPQMPVAPPAPPRNAGGPTIVIDNTRGDANSGGNGQNTGTARNGQDAALDTERARAGVFANRATTVVQGTMIPAVLETGFDSTRAGFARALVQRDIHGFDGTQVLIPRGSRLIGEYRSNVAQGQKRALVNWTRLIRPDGATIELESPAVDPVGRNGIKANVDSHFLERFAGAILQSVLNVGVNLAARKADSGVVVALPGSFQGATGGIVQPAQIAPTLTVARGTSVSVFVARDLDFSDVSPRER